MNPQDLILQQMTEKLKNWEYIKRDPRPRGGWVRVMRKAFGMSTVFLANRLGVDQSSISHYEKAEQTGSISLKTLEKIAAAMECKLVYAIVPITSLDDILAEAAEKAAREQVERISQTMALEDQNISEKEKNALIQSQIEIFKADPKKIFKKK